MGRIKNAKSFFICFISGLVAGILLGVMIFNILISYRIDMYFKKITYLESIIEDKDSKLEKLEKSINNKNYIIKNIEILLIYDEDKIDESDTLIIEKEIREKYNILLGKEVKEIDSDMIPQIVDKRIFQISEKQFKLKINKIVVAETLKIWVEVSILDEI